MKILLKGILVFGFVAIFAAIVLVWVAEARFESAQRLEKEYRWQTAEKLYESAICVNPFNSEYLRGYADFLYRINYSRKDKLSCFKKSESLYKKAIALNPANASYYTGLGKVYAGMGINEPGSLSKAIESFKEALEKEPNGFAVNFVAAYTLTGFWKDLGEKDKVWVLDRWKTAFRMRPRYCNKFAYTWIWKNIKDFNILAGIQPVKTEKCLGK